VRLVRLFQRRRNPLPDAADGSPEIVIECDFLDSNYFSRQFRKFMNESPSSFRRRIL
jgi:AraC-like DNA-binding protein